jgi:hypothetical protein
MFCKERRRSPRGCFKCGDKGEGKKKYRFRDKKKKKEKF